MQEPGPKETVKIFLKDAGNQVLNDTVYCETRLKSTKGCLNCESEQGCRKLAEFGLLLSCISQFGEDTEAVKEAYLEMVREILRGNGFLKA